MHEIRSSALHGRQLRPLIAPKDKGTAEEPKRGSLTAIPVKRQEPRSTNHRGEDRERDVVNTAAVFFRRRKHMARVINVSPHGAMVQSDIEPRIGDTVEIQFAECNRTKCVVRWMKGNRLGLEFVNETVILGSIKDKNYIFAVEETKQGEQSRERPLYPRARRHGLIWTGTLYWTFEAFPVRLRNISADGALLEADCEVPVGSKVQLNMAEAGTLAGEVKWCEGKNIGVKFEDKFDLKLLALNKPDAPIPADNMVKPEYLKSDGNPSSPWAAMWDRLRPSDLQRF